MGLAQLQAALARLFTDAALRERFFADPAAIGRELGLASEEIAQLTKLGQGEIAEFARSLDQKRLSAVRDLLPLTARALGDRFDGLFLEHAERYRPGGIQKHLNDALAFARFLNDRRSLGQFDPPWLRSLARYEATSLEMRNSDRMVCIRLLGYRPGEMAAHVSVSGGRGELPRRPCLAVWVRMPRRHSLWHWVLPSGGDPGSAASVR